MTTPASDSAPMPTSDTGRPAPLPLPHRVTGPKRWWDWILAADPGLSSIQAGWRSLVSMVTGLAVGYGMSCAVGVPAMIGLMVGGMLGLMSAFLVAENTALRVARSIMWLPVPFTVAVTTAAALHPYHALELWMMVVAIALQVLLMRFVPPFGLYTGALLFGGFMAGAMINPPLASCGWIFLIALVTAAGLVVARLVLCYPMPREDLLRTQRAFLIESRRVLDSVSTALDPDADRERALQRIRRTFRRLNITTVTIDGRLAQPEVAADPEAAELLHQYLFDAELALQGIGQAVSQMTGKYVPARLREVMVVALVVARDAHLGRPDALHPAADLIRQQAAAKPEDPASDDTEVRVLARRVADLLDALGDSFTNWLGVGWNSPTARARVPFQATVALERNMPAGSGPAAQRVANSQSEGWRRVIPAVRGPLQALVAGAITLPIAEALDTTRYYWGLIGVMVGMMGSNTTPERIRRIGHRAVGTILGAILGIVLFELIGPGHIYWTLAIIVVSIALGSWGMAHRYAYWVTGLVVALVQLYALTTPFSHLPWLLTERLIDNVLGMAVAAVCAAVLLPVSTRKVEQEAKRAYLSAMEDLIKQVALRWKDPQEPVRLRGAARALDAALFQVDSVIRPAVRMPLSVRGRSGENLLGLLRAATRHAHALAAAADIDANLAPHVLVRVERITDVFTESLRALDHNLTTGERRTWVRVSPMVRDLESTLEKQGGASAGRLQTALRELSALDEVMGNLADTRGMTVTIPDTTDVPTSPLPQVVQTSESTVADRDQRTALTAWAATMRRQPAPVTAHAQAATPRPAVAGAAKANKGAPYAVPAAPAPRPASRKPAATISGALHCPRHPHGCDAWISAVSDRGKQHARVGTTNGRYQITDLPPGNYTLIASSSTHAPSAEVVRVAKAGEDLRCDITLQPVN